MHNDNRMAIEIKDLSCQAGDKKILNDIYFSLKQGETLGLLGPNGAGKTTLLRLLCGLGKSLTGEIFFFGQRVLPKRSREIKELIGLVPQENNMERELSIKEGIMSYGELYGLKNCQERVEKLLQEFNIEPWQDKKPEEISGGMHRRAMIARACLTSPKILILDEPSVGLDPLLRQEIWQEIKRLKEKGTTVLLTTHYMDEAEALCDKIALLNKGEIICLDEAANIKARAGNREAGSLEEAYLSLLGGKEK